MSRQYFMHCIVSLWLLCGLAAGQVAELRSGTIQGIVTEDGSGQALGGVEVWLERPEAPARDPLRPSLRPEESFPFLTLTEPDGRFLLEEVPPGGYRLFADRRGWLQQQYGQRSPEEPGSLVSVRPGERMTLDFRMLRTGAISGRVSDEAGSPVEGVPVYAEAYQFRSGKHVRLDLSRTRLGSARRIPSVLPDMGYSVTDEEGRYRLDGLPPGDYFVVVRYQAGEAAREGFDEIIERDPVSPIYYPGTIRADDAAPVRVTGNDVVGINIRWSPLSPVSVSGELLGYEGAMNLSLRVATQDGVPVAPLTVMRPLEPEGTFKLLLPPFQSYLLTARADMFGAVGMTRIDVGSADLEDVDIVLRPPSSINGQIVVSPGTATPDLSRLVVQLVEGSEGYGDALISSAGVRGDGTFRSSRLTGTRGYRLALQGLPEDYYMESATFGGVDVLADGLALTSEQPVNNLLTIRLGSAPGKVTGTVVDARGIPRAGKRVTLVPGGIYRDRYDRYRAVYTGEDGAFRIEGVPPGPYRIFAWEAIPIDAEMNAEFLTAFQGRGRSVRVQRGSNIEVELRAIESLP